MSMPPRNDEEETDAEFAAKVEANDSVSAKRIDQLELEVTALRKELAEVTKAFQKECDHDWEKVDASFDHAFGTKVIRYMQCEICGKIAEPGDVDFPEADDEPRIDQRELREIDP